MAGAQSAAALTLNGGPIYAGSSPVTGSCTYTGNPCSSGGATVTCGSVNAGSFLNLYYGLRNDSSVNGLKETGNAGPVAGTDQFKSGTGSITYTGTTTVHNNVTGASSSQAVRSGLALSIVSVTGGTMTATATSGNPANNTNGDIDLVYSLSSGVTGFSMSVKVLAALSPTTATAGSCPTVFDVAHATNATDQDVSRMNFGFYWRNNCGDGITNGSEGCDEGGFNGNTQSCCTSTCTLRVGGSACDDDGNQCTTDSCNGTSGACQHVNKSNGTACIGNGSGVCSNPDTCNGSGVCLNNDVAATVQCRASGGECDVADNCDGAGACSADVKEPNLTPCTDEGNDCTFDQCDGTNNACQHPNKSDGTLCGSGSDTDCDNPDTCSSGTCSPNYEPGTVLCRASGGVCDLADNCDGAGACSTDGKSTAVCRSSAGACDAAESCDGTTDDCPADMKSTAVCRAAAGGCDIAEVCDGTSDNCAGDTVQSNGFECRPSGGVCDFAETCDGTDVNCPTDLKSTAECRASMGVCDLADSCDGTNDDCPADAKSTAECRSSAGVCDLADACDGTNDDCPADAKSTAVCRSSADTCDVAESCDGTNDDCPTDGFEAATVVCRSSAGACDVIEHCTGGGVTCPADQVASSTTTCRASAGACDLTEPCDGSTVDCPADAKSTAQCRASAGVCDVAESCDGTSNNCPTNAFVPNNTSCSDSVFCNGAETCQSGVCTDGADPCPIICDEANDECLTSNCSDIPEAGCRTAQKSLLLIKNKDDNTKDKMIWKWIKGGATTQAEMGDPTTSTSYILCIYSGAGQSLVSSVEVPPGSNWAPLGDSGYQYSDDSGAAQGAQKIKMKGSTQAKSKILFKAGGANLADPLDSAQLDLPVKVQLVNESDPSVCFEANFPAAKKTTQTQFKAKQ